MREIAFPKYIIKKINSLILNFFFSKNEQNKIHMIAWRNTTLPTSKGVIGILKVSDLNTILKIKKIWKLLLHASLFSKWCSQKYISLWDTSTVKSSSLWKSLKSIANAYKSSFSCLPGVQSPHSLYFGHGV